MNNNNSAIVPYSNVLRYEAEAVLHERNEYLNKMVNEVRSYTDNQQYVINAVGELVASVGTKNYSKQLEKVQIALDLKVFSNSKILKKFKKKVSVYSQLDRIEELKERVNEKNAGRSLSEKDFKRITVIEKKLTSLKEYLNESEIIYNKIVDIKSNLEKASKGAVTHRNGMIKAAALTAFFATGFFLLAAITFTLGTGYLSLFAVSVPTLITLSATIGDFRTQRQERKACLESMQNTQFSKLADEFKNITSKI